MGKAQHKPGLPGGLDLGIDDDAPADLGHVIPLTPRPSPEPVKEIPQPAQAKEAQPRPQQRKKKKKKAPAAEKAEALVPSAPRKRPPARYVGTSKGTDVLVDRIVKQLVDGGPERSASASEFFQASARVVARIAHSGRYSRLRPRGKWGTPSADDFVETLADIYFEAIGQLYVKEHHQEIRERIEAEIAAEQEAQD